MLQEKYWSSPVPTYDDFGFEIEDEFVDGRVAGRSSWGLMSPQAWALHGCGQLGTGHGQRYKLQSDGRWLKVEG